MKMKKTRNHGQEIEAIQS